MFVFYFILISLKYPLILPMMWFTLSGGPSELTDARLAVPLKSYGIEILLYSHLKKYYFKSKTVL